NGLRMSLTILGNEFIIIINYFVLILRPEFTIFWAIFITSFLTFNTCELKGILKFNEGNEEKSP
ncbi:hypothetical protein NWP18_05740, partial [Chrysosporum ovalisporum ANA283AFssAo]|uniref:hypothetical protein n=1 Tax=Umezakia ovalisporum TaxID=75695 RepID=UPI0024739DA3